MIKTDKLTVQDLAMFIGCDAFYYTPLGKQKITITPFWLKILSESVSVDLIKPILRPLSDITNEEMKQMECFSPEGYLGYSAEGYRFLTSKQFDVFNWIEKGLAI